MDVNLEFVGIDGWDRPVYKDANGILWKDINLGQGAPLLYSACNNEFEGEPDCPMSEY